MHWSCHIARVYSHRSWQGVAYLQRQLRRLMGNVRGDNYSDFFYSQFHEVLTRGIWQLHIYLPSSNASTFNCSKTLAGRTSATTSEWPESIYRRPKVNYRQHPPFIFKSSQSKLLHGVSWMGMLIAAVDLLWIICTPVPIGCPWEAQQSPLAKANSSAIRVASWDVVALEVSTLESWTSYMCVDWLIWMSYYLFEFYFTSAI